MPLRAAEVSPHPHPAVAALLIVDALDVASGGPEPLGSAWVRQQAVAQRACVILVTSELSPAQRSLLQRHDLPVVHIDPVDPLDGVQSIASTNFAGGMQAAQHLLDLGHRHIAFAGGTPRSMPVRERHQGYLAALTAGGGDVDPALVLQRGFGYEAGVDVATELLTLPELPTAIFAATDAAALGVLEAARRQGLRVPEDLSVVGFDDTYAAMGLTTTFAYAISRRGLAFGGQRVLRDVSYLCVTYLEHGPRRRETPERCSAPSAPVSAPSPRSRSAPAWPPPHWNEPSRSWSSDVWSSSSSRSRTTTTRNTTRSAARRANMAYRLV